MSDETKKQEDISKEGKTSKSGLLLGSEALREIRERYSATVSDGGSTGVSDTNDNSGNNN
jgi:hypothetical protein